MKPVSASNGPQVIEQEAGIEEYDSRNRPFIWSMTGGEIRAASGLVDALVSDGVNAVKTAMNEAIAKGVPVQHRSDNYDDYLRRLSQFDTRQQADTAQIKQLLPGRINNESVPKPRRAVAEQTGARRALMSGLCPSVQVADGHINGENVRFIRRGPGC